jgi:hypothetical protein
MEQGHIATPEDSREPRTFVMAEITEVRYDNQANALLFKFTDVDGDVVEYTAALLGFPRRVN